LDNPTRGNPAPFERTDGRVARTGTRRESRRQGQEGRARRTIRIVARTGRRSSRATPRQRVERSRRAAANGQGAATSIGFFPPQEAPRGAVVWRGPHPRCRACTRPVGNRRWSATRTRRNTVQRRIAHAADPQAPRSTEEAEPQGTPLAPEDQVNHIPVRRTAMVPPQGEPRGETQAAARKGAGRTHPSANL